MDTGHMGSPCAAAPGRLNWFHATTTTTIRSLCVCQCAACADENSSPSVLQCVPLVLFFLSPKDGVILTGLTLITSNGSGEMGFGAQTHTITGNRMKRWRLQINDKDSLQSFQDLHKFKAAICSRKC